MTMTMNRSLTATRGSVLGSPLLWLGLAVACACLLMAMPLRVPVGPMYWDVIIYYDAAARIFDGQVPINDFFAPVGPLGYYLFAGWLVVFPDANPVLIAHWSLLAVTAPLMAVVLWDVDGRSRATAVALLVPFLIFALLPFNNREFYPYPGSDGFGIYNRQCCQMLYVLVAALLFVRDRRVLGFAVFATMLALFFLKITGFVAALVICAFAFLAGRITLRVAIATALPFFAVLAGLELSSELVSHYFRDILLLIEKNDSTLLPRFLQAMSLTFGVVAPAGGLALVIAWTDRREFAGRLGAVLKERTPAALARLLDHNALWLVVVVFAGILFETQNTGSQAMIFLWPVVLAVLLRVTRMMSNPAMMAAALGLAAAAVLPTAVNTIERAARTYAGAVKNVPLEHSNLKTLGALTMREDVRDRASLMMQFYPKHRETYEDFFRIGHLPGPLLYSDFDFQITHLMAIDQAIDSIHRIERDRGVRFETIMTIAFVNTFPWLMDRKAPEHIAIGADPTRAVPDPTSAELEAIRNVDLALYPKCPFNMSSKMLLDLYDEALSHHRRIALDDCFDAFVHPRFSDRLK